ncbi:MAG: hypothetical protein A3K10_17675 [Bacteroidetes bacterium RIFCSPLOWO2_12_FULL_31_6]|nr:MAG: hypothetical protein A3K10_17675 [Bacteroidetes bacterium RIFCSPLOWO2_12_FULL_31_6]
MTMNRKYTNEIQNYSDTLNNWTDRKNWSNSYNTVGGGLGQGFFYSLNKKFGFGIYSEIEIFEALLDAGNWFNFPDINCVLGGEVEFSPKDNVLLQIRYGKDIIAAGKYKGNRLGFGIILFLHQEKIKRVRYGLQMKVDYKVFESTGLPEHKYNYYPSNGSYNSIEILQTDVTSLTIKVGIVLSIQDGKIINLNQE